MNKNFLIIVIAVLLICVGLNGCEEKGKTQNGDIDIEKMILGSWTHIETIITIDENTTSYNATNTTSVLTFYTNESYKMENNGLLMEWGDYEIKGNKLLLKKYDVPTAPYIIGISKDGAHMTFTFTGVFPDGRISKTVSRYIKE